MSLIKHLRFGSPYGGEYGFGKDYRHFYGQYGDVNKKLILSVREAYMKKMKKKGISVNEYQIRQHVLSILQATGRL
jgi:hypothetical protein